MDHAHARALGSKLLGRCQRPELANGLSGAAQIAPREDERIKTALRARLEIDFTTHMFQHAAVTFIADVAPQLAMMIIGVLGHTDITMAEQHYIRGQQKRAFTMYQDQILAIIEAAGELAD